MRTTELLKERRTYYQINKDIPVSEEDVIRFVEATTELVPDSFDMKSSRVVLVLGKKHDELWDAIYDAFEGKVPREKIDSFKAGYGTVLYFVNEPTVKALQEKFPLYAANFPGWANQAVGMLQINIWTGFRELNIGASLQHYNPIINDTVRKLFNLSEDWTLNAQMPFGGIVAEPDAKEKEDISQRVIIAR